MLFFWPCTFLVIFFIQTLNNFLATIPSLYKNIALFCFVLGAIYFGYRLIFDKSSYIYPLLIAALILCSRFKKTEPFNPQDPYKGAETSFQQFIRSFVVIDYHYKVDFYYFNHLRNFTALSTLLYLKYLRLRHGPLAYTFLWDTESCKLALAMFAFVFVFNLLILVFIQLTIINYCNPIVKGPTMHKKFTMVTSFGALAAGFGTIYDPGFFFFIRWLKIHWLI